MKIRIKRYRKERIIFELTIYHLRFIHIIELV